MAKSSNDKGGELPSWIRIEGKKILLNTKMTAYFFSVSTRTLSNWHQKGCPKYDRGWWNPKKIMQWHHENNDEDNLAAQKLKAEVRYKEARAEREMRTLEVEEGEYLEKEEVKEEWVRRVIEIKNGLLSLSRKVAGQIPDQETRALVEGVIEDEVYDLLEQFARRGRYTPTSEEA